MQSRRMVFLLLAALSAAALLTGCGGSPKETPKSASAVVSSVTGTPVGMDNCTQCHTVVTADWMKSKHANAENGLSSAGSPTIGDMADPACKACHDRLGDSARLAAGYTGNVARPVVGCEDCHGGGANHNGSGPIGLVTMNAAVVGSTTTLQVSAQFLTCSRCHELLDQVDPVSVATTTSAHAPVSLITPSGNQYLITDTHFAKTTATTGLIAVNGYAMDYASETVCTDCHNPHKTSNVHSEWAQSAKADRTRSGQDPQGYFSAAWSRNNWTASNYTPCQRCHTTTGFKKYADALRTSDQVTIDGMNDGTIAALAALPTVTYWKPEMLECKACHTDNKGTLRNPGPVTAKYNVLMSYPTSTYSAATYARVDFTFPDVAESNVCLACHTGRESGGSIEQLNVQSGMPSVDFNNLSFQNSHYLTGGGTVFKTTGYEFGGRSYGNPGSYLHDQIGMNNFRSTGTRGPCVGCHMSRPNGNGNHLFLPVSRFNRVRTNAGTVTLTSASATVTGSGTTWTSAGIDTVADVFLGPDNRKYQIASVDSDTQITLTTVYRGSGTTQTGANKNYVIARDGLRITGIASEVCFSCHAGTSTLLVDQLNEAREEFEEALLALEHTLDKKGISFLEAYPYFNKTRTIVGTVSVLTGGLTVTGSSTLFSTNSVSATTDQFRTYDGTIYDIQSVDSETQITLKSPYLGATGSGLSYAIVRSGSSNAIKDWTGADNDATGETSGKNNMGAAFNLNLLEHDPGAYVHNRTYAKRLIYDAFDWIDDNQLNYSVGATLNAPGSEPYKTKAVRYLLPNGVQWTETYPAGYGNAFERP